MCFAKRLKKPACRSTHSPSAMCWLPEPVERESYIRPRMVSKAMITRRALYSSVEYDGRRVLLTGDLESEGVRRLLAGSPLDCDILMAPHHGSARSDPAAVVSWSTPEWAVISSGYSAAVSPNTYEPQLGPRALNTAEVGAVRARLSASAWRSAPGTSTLGNEGLMPFLD